MKDSCGVDMSKTYTDMSKVLVTTNPLDHAHNRVKLLNMNSTQVVVVVVVVLISVVLLVDKYVQMKRIGQLEMKQEDQEALIRELHESLRRLRDIIDEGGDQTTRYGTTEAEEQLQKTGAFNERESKSYTAKRRNQATVGDDKIGKQLSNKRRGDVKGNEYLKRVKRPAADPHSSGESSQEITTREKRKGSKKGRKKKVGKRCRQDNSTCGTPTCELVNECNEARHGGRSNCNHVVAQFEQHSDSLQIIGCQRDAFNDQFVSCDDDVIGNWKHASWTLEEHSDKLPIKSMLHNFPDRPRKSMIEVKETGLYYIYSQITFADESSYLGHSVLIDDEIKFTCSLWVTDVQANTCTTGGLVRIEANQLVHIQLIQRNRIINMDSANTFFGIIQMMTV